MKPDTQTAMRDLIRQVRTAMPFSDPAAQECPDLCKGCTPKLLAQLESELDDWQQRLREGETPTLGDIDRLAKMSKKIYRVLQENGLISERHTS